MKDFNGTTASPSVSNTPSSGRTHGLPLACRECHRKKLKCDRHFPCGRCSRSGLPCVPSARKPRAKAGAKAGDAELRERIAKLERLVESLPGDESRDATNAESKAAISHETPAEPRLSVSNESATKPNFESPSSLTDAASPHSSKVNKYVAGNFWSCLTYEVKALADAFEEDGLLSDEDATSPDATAPSAPYAMDPSHNVIAGYELIFCPPGVLYIMPGALQDPDPAMAAELLNHYLQHVEPVYKLFHIPTLKAFMQDGQHYLGKPSDAPCNKALKASISFAGINALTNDECLTSYGKPLDQLVQEFKRIVDIALYQADLLNTTDIATVQALLLYTASIRVLDSSRRAWSIVGLLVRIARAMNMHRELQGETPFHAELRRRLWYNIVLLDCYASLDRGSESAIHPDTFTRLLPTNCYDNDFDEQSSFIPNREGEITDTSLPLIMQEGCISSLRMALPGLTWRQRLETAYEFQRKANEKFLRHCNPDIPFHKRMMGIATAACCSMLLRAVRPMDHDVASSPPRIDSPWVMQLALNILRHASQLWLYHADGWRGMPWVPWHPIAVTLAGLCSVRGTEMANEAWELVEKAMERYGRDVADSKNGMLWRPLRKLYKKAAAFRDAGDTQVPVPEPQQPPANAPYDGVALGRAMPPPPGAMMLDAMNLPASESVFDFPLEMQAALPNDNSWLDWEAILKDMDEVMVDDMQWVS